MTRGYSITEGYRAWYPTGIPQLMGYSYSDMGRHHKPGHLFDQINQTIYIYIYIAFLFNMEPPNTLLLQNTPDKI